MIRDQNSPILESSHKFTLVFFGPAWSLTNVWDLCDSYIV